MTDDVKPPSLLGEFHIEKSLFSQLDKIIKQFKNKEFSDLNDHEKRKRVTQELVRLIQKEKEPCFLLPALIEYMTCLEKEKIVEHYTFSVFELYLNRFMTLTQTENQAIRSRIVGKAMPRDSYQAYFPIGMGRVYSGTHFVTAHKSPDLDTTVASFWGWIDAFAARVGDGLHIWNLPGGPPTTQVEISLLFENIFGKRVFDYLAKTRLSLTLTSLDLMSQKGMSKKQTSDLALNFDHDRSRSAVVLVDAEGYYLGDWRSIDVEGVRQIVMGLNNCLMWLESHLHIKLISCFAKKDLTLEYITHLIQDILNIKISDCQPAHELPSKQLGFLRDYLVKVLGITKGIEATFEEFALGMEHLHIANFSQIITWLKSLIHSDLFDSSGKLTENRPLIFNQLEVLVKMLDQAFVSIRAYVDRLEVAFKIKTDVFGFVPQYLTHRTDLGEIRTKIDSYSYLTVNHIDRNGRYVPLGVVHAVDLQKNVLGSVSLRDFCNREEMKIPNYLEIISVVDHHKTDLETSCAPSVVIGDAQSSNSLVAGLAFRLNDHYGTGTMDEKTVEKQLKELGSQLTSAQNIRLYQRLLQKKKIFSLSDPYYFIHPHREYIEYLHFVYAILDDTDLLTKVSRLDVECMASLLNRLKSLALGKEVEIIHFDDIQKECDFTAKAAKRLLQNRDFYSLYSQVYLHKEQSVEKNLLECAQGIQTNIFTDTKILNFCNRVGQTKIFACNYPAFNQVAPQLRKIWYQQALNIYANNGEIMLHLHMISTIASADELFKGESVHYMHQDELWFWIPTTELAIERLKVFLSSFKELSNLMHLDLSLELLGDNGNELSQIFKESFFSKMKHTFSQTKENLPMAVLRFPAGALNSRKAMIAPFLPQLDK